ncbi:MAG TPA: hypothetical protein VN040_06560 [Pseudosphingobacterium sp.]|nr:hypothetical protein [Pseudosphingobacterium sp.]
MSNKRISQQLRTFERLLTSYDKKEPLARFLTSFFKENRQMGSSDRRVTSRWVYNYFRLGKSLEEYSITERLVFAEYLCSGESELVADLNPTLNNSINQPIEEKMTLLSHSVGFQQADVFPLLELVSMAIDKELFIDSLFLQPLLFIRVHPGEKDFVTDRLIQREVIYEEIGENCLALPNGTKLSQYRELEGKYQVQDLSSQRTAPYFKAKTGEQWWDACAASGGKSLLLLHHYHGIKLLVSDVRPSILRNLDERFEQAKIKGYRRKIIDLTKDSSPVLGNEQFDGIIVDAPCTGSGTWGRTPEMMQPFTKERLDYFVRLQRVIVLEAIKHLKPGSPLIYITCSVYADENEHQLSFFEQEDLKVEAMELIKGYENRADTMFVARLIKKL